MASAADIFLDPGKLFLELKEKPSFVLPLLVVMVLMAAMTWYYFASVDPGWYVDHTLLASNDQMSATELAQARSVFPGVRTLGTIGAVSSAVVAAVISVLYALYFLLAGKVTGREVSFPQAMSLACWSNMPMVLGILVAIAGIATMTPQTTIESLMLTNLDPLVLQLPPDSAWNRLAESFNLLNFWVIFLAALGWRTWGKSSWTQALVVGVLPSAVIYGVMAAIALS
jgi:hypothetical protein